MAYITQLASGISKIFETKRDSLSMTFFSLMLVIISVFILLFAYTGEAAGLKEPAVFAFWVNTLFLAIIPVGLFFFAQDLGAKIVFSLSIGFGGALLAGLAVLLYPDSFPNSARFFLGFLVLYWLILFGVREKRKPALEYTHWVHLALFGVILYGLLLRVEKLTSLASTPLWPDAIYYKVLAEKFSYLHFYAASVREPFFVFLVRLWFDIFGASELHLRLLTVFFSCLLIFLSYKVARNLFNQTFGLIAVSLVAFSPFLVHLSVQGMREDLVACIILTYLFVLFAKNKQAEKTKVLLAGLLIALLALVRFETLYIGIALLPVGFWHNKWHWRWLPLPILVAVLLVTPFLWNNYLTYSDPLYHSNIHAVWWRNHEFGGQPGYPSREEIAQNGYAGPATSNFEYIFKLHSLPDILRQIAGGMRTAPTALIDLCIGGYLGRFLLYLTVLGFAVALVSYCRFLPLAVFVSLLLYAFYIPIGLDLRTIMFIFPLFVMLALVPCYLGWLYMANYDEYRTKISWQPVMKWFPWFPGADNNRFN